MRSPVMSDAQLVLAFVLDGQSPTLADREASLSLAKQCLSEVDQIAAGMGKPRDPDGKWA